MTAQVGSAPLPAADLPSEDSALPPAASPLSEASQFEQAKSCFSEPLCSQEEAARLYLAAADADQLPIVTEGLGAGFDCYVLLRGVGIPADPTRARRCFERVVAASDCSNGSPWLPRLELAVLWLAGRGGPADPARSRALLDHCFQDGSVQMVQQKARHAAGHPDSMAELDFCRDIVGTTLAMNSCARIDSQLSSRELDIMAKQPTFAANLTVRQALATANESFFAYAYAQAAWSRDLYRGGSMAPLVFNGTYGSMVAQRNVRLRAIAEADYQGKKASMRAAEQELKREYEGARLGAVDAQRRRLLDQAQHAFVGYRKAEVNLYAAAMAKEHPEQAVRRQVRTDLSLARSETIRAGLQP